MRSCGGGERDRALHEHPCDRDSLQISDHSRVLGSATGNGRARCNTLLRSDWVIVLVSKASSLPVLINVDAILLANDAVRRRIIAMPLLNQSRIRVFEGVMHVWPNDWLTDTSHLSKSPHLVTGERGEEAAFLLSATPGLHDCCSALSLGTAARRYRSDRLGSRYAVLHRSEDSQQPQQLLLLKLQSTRRNEILCAGLPTCTCGPILPGRIRASISCLSIPQKQAPRNLTFSAAHLAGTRCIRFSRLLRVEIFLVPGHLDRLQL